MLSPYIRILAIFVGLLSSLATFAEQKPLPVIVNGQGRTYWEAREDCVRQALQESLSQLVIADRRIENDKIVRDSILSTMNGFVESFRVLNQSASNGKVEIKAEVQISQSGIENFVLSGGKGSAKIDGNALLADVSRDDLARTSRTEILKRLFDGFPSRAFDVKVAKVSVDPENRGFILVALQVQANKEFIRNLKGGLKVIGRSGPPDYKTPDQVSVCFTYGSVLADSLWLTDCLAVAADLPSLHQQAMDSHGGLHFMVWFSTSSPSPLLVTSRDPLNPYAPSGDLFRSKTDGAFGRMDHGVITISEAVNTFTLRISREYVPERSKEIHALPLYVGATLDNSVFSEHVRAEFSSK